MLLASPYRDATRQSGFHAFRHSAASFINSKTGNTKLAQKLLGHAGLDMTALYTHADDKSEREAALALESNHRATPRIALEQLCSTLPRILK